jgi:hypothetical protein
VRKSYNLTENTFDCFTLERGGDSLKFSDVIIAVASLALVNFLVESLLNFALIPMNTYWGGDIALILSLLVSALIVGYVFAGKIREESRMTSMGKIVVLNALLVLFVCMLVFGAAGHSGAWIDENLTNMYGKTATSSWTNTDWFGYEIGALFSLTAVDIVYSLVFGFIGLYLGSMRKPSTKTTE